MNIKAIYYSYREFYIVITITFGHHKAFCCWKDCSVICIMLVCVIFALYMVAHLTLETMFDIQCTIYIYRERERAIK